MSWLFGTKTTGHRNTEKIFVHQPFLLISLICLIVLISIEMTPLFVSCISSASLLPYYNSSSINNHHHYKYSLSNGGIPRIRSSRTKSARVIPPPPLTTSQIHNSSVYNLPPSPPLPPQKAHGLLDCIFRIFKDIDRCNQTYHQSLANKIARGYRIESKVYRRHFCCGHLVRERCIIFAAERECDLETLEKIREDPSSISQTKAAASLDPRHANINCDEFFLENSQPICAGQQSYQHAYWRILLILYWSSSLLPTFFYLF